MVCRHLYNFLTLFMSITSGGIRDIRVDFSNLIVIFCYHHSHGTWMTIVIFPKLPTMGIKKQIQIYSIKFNIVALFVYLFEQFFHVFFLNLIQLPCFRKHKNSTTFSMSPLFHHWFIVRRWSRSILVFSRRYFSTPFGEPFFCLSSTFCRTEEVFWVVTHLARQNYGMRVNDKYFFSFYHYK